MRSMTGFGRTQLERGGTQVVAEVRALNQRFFELKLNLPRGWGEHEAEIRKIVQGAVASVALPWYCRQLAQVCSGLCVGLVFASTLVVSVT